jgi:octaprenyl-diphosphate synthase
LSTLATETAKEVFDLLRDDLVAIEQELGRDAASGVSTITEIAEYLRGGGGKRIRPTLLLLSAHTLGYTGPNSIRLGAVVEMVHTATLVHDDIIDGADMRRGRPSANTTWGNEKCVLAGDWLYMQAFKVALEEKSLRVLDLLIGLTQQMVEGELLQIQKLGRPVSEAEYYDLIYRKTACLFSVSMRLGAAAGRGHGGPGSEPGRLWPRNRPGLPDCRRRARPDRDGGSPGQARGQRSARGQGDALGDPLHRPRHCRRPANDPKSFR